MEIIREEFYKGFKEGTVKKMLKKGMKKNYLMQVPKKSKQLLNDCKFFPEELLDFILILYPRSEEEAVKAINDWLHLETKATGDEREKYEYGKGKDLFEKISLQRKLFLIGSLE